VDRCVFCDKLIRLSSEIIKENRVLYVTKEKIDEKKPGAVNIYLPLLNGDTAYLNCAEYSEIIEYQKNMTEKS